MSTPTLALPIPRHACHGCGGSCQGVKVRPGPDELAPLAAQAAELGIADPVVDGVLRQDAGRCVFLDEADACRIHGRWGADAKPHICQQFPLLVLRTDGGVRVGVDPGCYHAWRTWRTGPEPAPDAVLISADKPRPAAEQRAEATLLGLLAAVQTPAQALAQLAAPGIEQRWATLLGSLDPAALLARTPGPKARAAIGPMLTPPASAPPWPALTPDQAAYTLSAVRTFVALRQGDPQLHAIGSTVLMLLGALTAAWHDTAPEPYGLALAGWSRCLRLPVFWSTVIAGPDVLRALVGGPARPGVS